MSLQNTRAYCQLTEAYMTFIALWKVYRSLFSPNGILVYLCKAWYKKNAVLLRFRSSILILQYPKIAASVKNTLISPIPLSKFIHATERVRITHRNGARFLTIDVEVQWAVFPEGEHNMCRPFSSSLLFALLDEHSSYFRCQKLPCYRPCSVHDRVNQSSPTIDEINADSGHSYTHEYAFLQALEAHNHFDSCLTALRKLGG